MNKKNIYIGWDIGGAHTKYTILKSNSMLLTSKINSLHLWKSLTPLQSIIKNIYFKYGDRYKIVNAISMSGEMCDIFDTRKQGVEKILSLFNCKLFDNYIYTSTHGVIPIQKYGNYQSVASMNWHIIANYLKSFYKNIIAIDLGSTTTDFILIKNSKCINKRIDDYTGLSSSELLYTGALRTPVFSVLKNIKYKNQSYNLIPEFYATMGDIYRLLGIISIKDDYSDTADGRSKSKKNSLVRISRSLGIDYTVNHSQLIMSISKKIMSEHLDQISYTMKGHMDKNFNDINDLQFIGMGVGEPIIKILCKKNKWDYLGLNNFLGSTYVSKLHKLSSTTPSFLLSLLLKKVYEK